MRFKINLSGDLIGLDLGRSRTGVARINTHAKIAEPLAEITMDDNFLAHVQQLAGELDAACIVAGVPRGLDGQETEQTKWALDVVMSLQAACTIPVFTVDEAGTTKLAEERAAQGQSIDSVAACIIVEDFLTEVVRGKVENVYVSA